MDATIKNLSKICDIELHRSLGIEITHWEKGKIIATMPVDERHHQPLGLLHGGVSVVLAESVASIGGTLLAMEDGRVCVGQEINANHIKSIKKGSVTATGVVIHSGKRSQVWEIKICDNHDGSLLCISRCTLAVIEH